MTVSFKDLVSTHLLSEDFTGINNKNIESTLTDDSPSREIANYIAKGDARKLADAASHPNAQEHHLDKALDHGGMDQIVAAHPNTTLRFLKRIIGSSKDSFARMAAAHNPNMKPSVLEKAYDTEKDPAVKAEMLRSRHMPEMMIKTELAHELQKSHPSQYKLESIAANINSPHESVNAAYARMNEPSKPYMTVHDDVPTTTRKPKTGAPIKKLGKIIDDYRLNSGASLNDINIDHESDPENHSITIHAKHTFDDTAPGVTSAGTFNAKAKDWARIGGRMDDLSDDEHVKKHFDISKTSMSLGRANSVAKHKVEGEPLQHSAALKLTLKPEYQ